MDYQFGLEVIRVGYTQEGRRKNFFPIGFEIELAALDVLADATRAAFVDVEPIVSGHVFAARRDGLDTERVALRRDPNTTSDRHNLPDLREAYICPRIGNDHVQNRD